MAELKKGIILKDIRDTHRNGLKTRNERLLHDLQKPNLI